jgi:hypothetical protein
MAIDVVGSGLGPMKDLMKAAEFKTDGLFTVVFHRNIPE